MKGASDPRGHIRRTSEPIDTGSSTQKNASQDRRSQFVREWSHPNLVGDGGDAATATNNTTAPVVNTPIPVTDFEANWSNFGGNFLGTSISPLAPLTSKSDRMESLGSTVSLRTDSSGLSSTLHDAARITDWDKVLALCAAHPEYAKYSGRDGWTALHHACNRRCPLPEVAEALIRAHPGALLKEDEKGWLPLHYACRFKAPKDVVRLLLQMYPDKGRATVSKRDRLGRTPLYYAVRYDAPPGVVGLLLEVDPSAVLEEDQNEDSPLALVWDSWAEKLEGKRILQPFLAGSSSESVSDSGRSAEERAVQLRDRLKREPKLYKKWQKVNMLLKAAFGFSVEDENVPEYSDEKKDSQVSDRKWRIVHATAAVKCHLSLFLLACALHPEQARELDESDLRRPGEHHDYAEGLSTHQTALHLAASSNVGGEHGKKVIITLLSLYRDAAEIQDGLDGSLALHRMVENERKQDWPQHAAILYHFFPRAVRVADNNGKLPLHRAASAMTHIEREDSEDNVQRSVIIQLVRSFPQAASHADNSGCLPLHMIAMHAEVWDDDVEAVLAAHPAAVQARAGPSLDNRLPLHLAASSPDSRESLLQRLVELHPRCASQMDRQGKFPLHLACELGKEWDAGVSAVHQAFPDAINRAEENSRGWLCLHMASACPSASVNLISRLIELNPAAASVVDREGRYPLHLACRSGKNWQGGLEALFDANAGAVGESDNTGMLPLHIAAFRYCAPEVDAESETSTQTSTSQDSNETEQAVKLDILFNLLRADPTVLSSM